MADRPETADEARKLMLDWAQGTRTWGNLGPHMPYTPDVIAVMDTQEVIKWAAVYQAMVVVQSGSEVSV